jgi:hypothetical protein
MKLYLQVQKDGRISGITNINTPSPDIDLVEIDGLNLHKIFGGDLEPRYWQDGKVVERPLPESVTFYYQRLGAFTQAFAKLEATMQDALRVFCNVTPEVARSIFPAREPRPPSRTSSASRMLSRCLPTSEQN